MPDAIDDWVRQCDSLERKVRQNVSVAASELNELLDFLHGAGWDAELLVYCIALSIGLGHMELRTRTRP
jgi:hypothetical protein